MRPRESIQLIGTGSSSGQREPRHVPCRSERPNAHRTPRSRPPSTPAHHTHRLTNHVSVLLAQHLTNCSACRRSADASVPCAADVRGRRRRGGPRCCLRGRRVRRCGSCTACGGASDDADHAALLARLRAPRRGPPAIQLARAVPQAAAVSPSGFAPARGTLRNPRGRKPVHQRNSSGSAEGRAPSPWRVPFSNLKRRMAGPARRLEPSYGRGTGDFRCGLPWA